MLIVLKYIYIYAIYICMQYIYYRWQGVIQCLHPYNIYHTDYNWSCIRNKFIYIVSFYCFFICFVNHVFEYIALHIDSKVAPVFQTDDFSMPLKFSSWSLLILLPLRSNSSLRSRFEINGEGGNVNTGVW